MAAGWLQTSTEQDKSGLGIVGFCFGGRVAMLASSLPQVVATRDFYGAGVVSGRPGGGPPPTLEQGYKAKGPLLCVFGNENPLIHLSARIVIEQEPEQPNRLRGTRLTHQILTLDG